MDLLLQSNTPINSYPREHRLSFAVILSFPGRWKHKMVNLILQIFEICWNRTPSWKINIYEHLQQITHTSLPKHTSLPITTFIFFFGNGFAADYQNPITKNIMEGGKIPFIQMKERCVLVITKNFQVMGIGLVICWSTSNHQNINLWVLGRGMSNLLEIYL